jgi:hypothetical protein
VPQLLWHGVWFVCLFGFFFWSHLKDCFIKLNCTTHKRMLRTSFYLDLQWFLKKCLKIFFFYHGNTCKNGFLYRGPSQLLDDHDVI